MSRRRRPPDGPPPGMPGWLAVYRPELWAADLDDPLQVHYFGRFPWREAQAEWSAGGEPQPKIQSPQTRTRGERQYGFDPWKPGGGGTSPALDLREES